MSRIPNPDRMRLAEQIQTVSVFGEKVKALEATKIAPHAATLCALHYEAVATIARLVALVDRGGNSVLISKAAEAIQHWNGIVTEARVLAKTG